MSDLLADELDGFESGDVMDQISTSSAESRGRSQTPLGAGEQEQADEEKKPEKVRLTVYLTPEYVDALEQVKAKRRNKTGKLFRRSHLIEEAVEHFIKQHL